MKVQNRRGISPIIATVLIIAATLIAAAAIVGYVFGIFGATGYPYQITVLVTQKVDYANLTSSFTQHYQTQNAVVLNATRLVPFSNGCAMVWIAFNDNHVNSTTYEACGFGGELKVGSSILINGLAPGAKVAFIEPVNGNAIYYVDLTGWNPISGTSTRPIISYSHTGT